MMRQFGVFLILIFVMFGAMAKPSPSLSLKIKWVDGAVIYDQPIEVQVSVMSQITSEDLRFTLNLPVGVTVIDGNTLLRRKIEAGQPLQLNFTLFIEKQAVGKIEAEASIGSAEQAFFRAASHITIDPPVVSQDVVSQNVASQNAISQKIGSRTLTAPAFQYTERDGVKIREYQLP